VQEEKKTTTVESGHVQQTASQRGKAGDAQRHRKLMMILSATKIDETTARRDTMNAKKTMMIVIARREEVEATGLVVLLPTPSTAAVAVTRRNTVHRARTAIAAKNIAVVIARAHHVKKTSTMTIPILTVTESQSLVHAANTGVRKRSIVTGRVTKTASEIDAIVRIAIRTMIMIGKKTDQETKTRSAGVDAIAKLKMKNATTTTISTDHLDEAARSEIVKSGTLMTVVETIVRRRANGQQKTI
jgi:hypothetical protein